MVAAPPLPQDEYVHLQRQYEELKSARIVQDVEALLDAAGAEVGEQLAAAHALADHWKAVAEGQAKDVQVRCIPTYNTD